MSSTEKYNKELIQDIKAQQLADEDGDLQEQVFTRMAVDLLSESGETENTAIAYEERYLGTPKQLKINGYGISENYETVDLFITIFDGGITVQKALKKEIEQAEKRISNFFRLAIYDDYASIIAESSEIFEFAVTLNSYKELRDNLIRVNVFILTNKIFDGEFPPAKEIAGYKIFYRVVDLNYLYNISQNAHTSIEINFKEEGYSIPCLAGNNKNDEYESYIAIIPGNCLADLYEKYGSKLLEQNVRAFLQFTGKINKGIRATIKNEPEMFLAFNNGIAATADNIVLSKEGKEIISVNNFQVVNGGQTTAAIYHTWKRDKADISKVFVQVKLSIIRNADNFADIVSRISRYSNTQNKVNDADFTSNNPCLIAIEQLSRNIMTPISEVHTLPTYWFFERVRGQYKTSRLKVGFTASGQKKFDLKYPKAQMLTKVDFAKYVNSYKEIYDGKKLVIGPHIVARGSEKNYALFINYNLSEQKNIDNIYFEDSIAKAILFKDCERRYGTKRDPFNIGDLRQTIVPYSISMFYIITEGKLNLYKIWKQQSVSEELSDFMYGLMKQINDFLADSYRGNNIIELSKKENMWEQVKLHHWSYNLDDISSDLLDPLNLPKRSSNKVVHNDGTEKELQVIRDIPYTLWKKIAEWGKDSGMLTPTLQISASEIANALKFNHTIRDSERNKAIRVFNIVVENNYELLEEADNLKKDIESENAKKVQAETYQSEQFPITLELIRKMVQWDKHRRILENWKWITMDKVAKGEISLTEDKKRAFMYNFRKLKSKGFSPDDD
jgi:hypothetical protein